MVGKTLKTGIAIFIISFTCHAGTWELPGIFGHGPGVWQDGVNWKWQQGNPMADNGASWALYYQEKPKSEFNLMTKGLAYKYNFVWRDADDSFGPAFMYQGKTLASTGGKVFPGKGPLAMVTFTPDTPGKFKIELDGAVTVAIPAAGHARLSIYVLDSAMKVIKEIKSADFKSREKVAITKNISLAAGERIGIAIQSIHPGKASCGMSSIDFKKLSITNIQ